MASTRTPTLLFQLLAEPLVRQDPADLSRCARKELATEDGVPQLLVALLAVNHRPSSPELAVAELILRELLLPKEQRYQMLVLETH